MIKGIYCLIIKVKNNIKVKIGSLGFLEFKKGHYAYIGSAQNNLKKRVERHLMKNKKKFWHIDYLLANKNVNIERVFYKKADKQQECKLSSFLSKVEKPVNNFGCSDCRCISHLFRLRNLDKINKLKLNKL